VTLNRREIVGIKAKPGTLKLSGLNKISNRELESEFGEKNARTRKSPGPDRRKING
jgi:hypothetical protein